MIDGGYFSAVDGGNRHLNRGGVAVAQQSHRRMAGCSVVHFLQNEIYLSSASVAYFCYVYSVSSTVKCLPAHVSDGLSLRYA